MNFYKKYVDVVAHYSLDGVMKPLFIIVDHEKYPIDRILQIKNATSSVGGSGVCYECRIQNQVRKLYFEQTRWFIESHRP